MLPASETRQDPGEAAPPALVECFLALAAGDASALEPLYDSLAQDVHGLALWRTGSAADAADVLQEVFVRLASAGRQLAAVREPRAYVLAMTHRCAIDVHRRRSRRREVAESEARFVAADTPAPERGLDADRACRLLTQLPAEQREAIHLHVLLGLTFRETARVTGVPTFTAASRFRLGLARLRRLAGQQP